MTSPYAAMILAVLLLLIAFSALVGCAEDRKIEQIQRGVHSFDRRSQEVEREAKQSP